MGPFKRVHAWREASRPRERRRIGAAPEPLFARRGARCRPGGARASAQARRLCSASSRRAQELRLRPPKAHLVVLDQHLSNGHLLDLGGAVGRPVVAVVVRRAAHLYLLPRAPLSSSRRHGCRTRSTLSPFCRWPLLRRSAAHASPHLSASALDLNAKAAGEPHRERNSGAGASARACAEMLAERLNAAAIALVPRERWNGRSAWSQPWARSARRSSVQRSTRTACPRGNC